MGTCPAFATMQWFDTTVSEEDVLRAVVVSNISENASKANVETFFTYCGGIETFQLATDPSPASSSSSSPPGGTQSALIVFSSPSGYTTALLLSNATIVDTPILVSPLSSSLPNVTSLSEPSDPSPPSEGEGEGDDGVGVKSKTCVLAEMVAAGYDVGSNAMARAAAFDEKHLRARAMLTSVGSVLSTATDAVDKTVSDVDAAIGFTPKAVAVSSKVDATIASVQQSVMSYSAVQTAVSAFQSACASVDTVVNSFSDQTTHALQRRRQQSTTASTEPTESTAESTEFTEPTEPTESAEPTESTDDQPSS